MPADNPKALLALKHGYNSSSIQYDLRKGHPDAPNVFRRLNDQGISVITLASERIPPGDTTFVRRYEEEVQKFFFDKKSPVYQIANGLPVHALAHSLGGLATLKNLTNRDNLDFASDNLESIHLMNPALAIAHVTRFSLVDSFYRAWSNTFPDNIPGTTLAGKSYMAFRGIPIEEDNPTHRQIQIMAAEGKACREKLQAMVNDGSFQHAFDLGFIVGTNDPTTCPVINLRTADMLGAQKITSTDRHTPILPPKGIAYESAADVPTPAALSLYVDTVLDNVRTYERIIQMNPEMGTGNGYTPPTANIA